MASGMYTKGISEMMSGNIDLVNTSLSCALVNSSLYSPNFVTDADLSYIPEASLLAEEDLTGKSLDTTVFKADDVVFPSVEGSSADAVILFVNASTIEDSTLICYLDNAAEFPIAPDGTDITIRWNAGGVFKL